ncbi:MAG TPA: aromatic amino acid transport family protein, partial [Terrimicrobiaceae bacterium]
MYFNLNRWLKMLNLRLEKLPPFWTVYAFILVETVGEGVLAIPIAVAKIGPLAGIVVLIIIGIVIMITIAALAEVSARSGSIRYGEAYLGRLVHDYLGSTGTVVLALSVAAIQLLALISYFVGF